MIQYALKCPAGHGFDSWFQSAAAFDRLAGAGMLACSICGSGQVEKSLMAPAITANLPAAKPVTLALPTTELEKHIAALRRKVEENSDYVGADFATLARAIHDGDAPERAIWGEARPDEARALIEDGIPVAPLPFLPARKAN